MTKSEDSKWLQENFPDLKSIAFLNDGGQKQVYTAMHEVDGSVVLKLIRPPVELEAVRREIQATQQIRSRRVPVIYGSGSIATPFGDCMWIREQKIDGNNLRKSLQNGPMQLAEAVCMTEHVLEALSEAEACNIVHRDVKPENIIREGNKRFWLIDFGIARHLGLKSITPSAALMGKHTPGYAPLEQVANIKTTIDVRADLYAMGVTMYESLVGQNPYTLGCQTESEVYERQQAIDCLELPPEYDGKLIDFVAALTQRDAVFRPTSAKECLNWVQEFASVARR